jgi:site-specific recombinase XerD
LKKACRLAYKEGYADRLFFANYTLPKMQVSTPKTITPENFKKIQSLKIPKERESLILSRDLLLFSCYTGADVISKMLGHTNITQTQVYARVTQKKLFEEAAKFAEATKDLVLVL